MTQRADPRLSRRTLRAMRSRWERDYTRLNAAYPVEDWTADKPTLETIRNLGTAIAQIDGIITNPFSCKGDKQR